MIIHLPPFSRKDNKQASVHCPSLVDVVGNSVHIDIKTTRRNTTAMPMESYIRGDA